MNWERYRRGVAPTPEAIERVRARVEAEHRPAPVTSLREVDPFAIGRVRARLANPQRRRATPRLIFAVAAAAALALLWPESKLDAPLTTGALAAGPNAIVMADGDGALRGTETEPMVEWRAGTLVVDVTPGQGVDFRVRTEEGEVRVLGTQFTVTRDRLGTTVSVTRGRVAVQCVDGPDGELTPGQSTTCLPLRAAGLLGRARALYEQRDLAGALASIDRALTAAPSEAVLDELLALRATAGFSLDPAAAVPAIDAALARPNTPRRASLLRLRARAAGDCAGALPWLDTIPEADRTAADLIARADCLDGQAALDALDAAAARATDSPTRAAIAARRHTLERP